MTLIRLKGSTEFALSLGRIGNSSLLGRSVHFGFRDNTGVDTSNSTYFLDNLQSQWHNFSFIYTGGDKSSISSYDFYGDGVLGVLAGVNTIGGSDNVNEVGRDAPATASGFVAGFTDEIRVWNGVRSKLEIRENMGKSLVPANEANLAACWKSDGSSVTDVTDSKGSNDGTISGATRVTSTAPLGSNSAFVATQSQTDMGPPGGQIQVTITSVPDDSNNLGVYQFGSLSGDPVTVGETFPLGIDRRSDTVWGIVERGTVTANLVFSYNGIAGVNNPSTVQILKRDNTDDTS